MGGNKSSHFLKLLNGILHNLESLCDQRPDFHHHFDAGGTLNAIFDELAERPLMSPLAGTKHTTCIILTLFQVVEWHITQFGILMW